MRSDGRFSRTTIGGQSALGTTIANVSEVTNDDETVRVLTTQLSDGSLFFAIAVVPERQSDAYAGTFQRIIDSVRFMR